MCGCYKWAIPGARPFRLFCSCSWRVGSSLCATAAMGHSNTSLQSYFIVPFSCSSQALVPLGKPWSSTILTYFSFLYAQGYFFLLGCAPIPTLLYSGCLPIFNSGSFPSEATTFVEIKYCSWRSNSSSYKIIFSFDECTAMLGCHHSIKRNVALIFFFGESYVVLFLEEI